MTTEQQHRIDDYLFGLGSPEERREFEEEAQRNPDLSAGLAATRQAMDAIEIFEDEQLKTRLRNLEATLSRPEAPTIEAPVAREAKVVAMRPIRQWLAIAATVLLLIVAGFWLTQGYDTSTPTQLAMQHFEPYENIAYQFERGNNVQSLEADSFRAYDRGDYAAAERGFTALPTSPTRSFYLAQAYLAQEKFSAAEPLLLEVSQSDFALAPESAYYLAVAYLGQDRVTEAGAILERIDGDDGHPMRKEARALLRKL